MAQTGKLGKRMPLVLYGKDFWDEVLDLDALVRWGTISPEDLQLIHRASSPDEAFEYLRTELTQLYLEGETDRADP